MLTGTFICEITDKNKIAVPSEIANRLNLKDGEKVEVQIKRIKTRRLDIKISKNPLNKLLELSGERSAK